MRRVLFGFRINSLKKQLVQRVIKVSKKLNFLLFSIPFGRGFDPWLATIFWKTLWGFHLFWMDCEKSGRWSSIFWADIVRGKPLQNDETNSVLDEKLTDICLENIWKKNKTDNRGVKTLNFLLFICNELPIYFKNNLYLFAIYFKNNLMKSLLHGLEFETSFVRISH